MISNLVKFLQVRRDVLAILIAVILSCCFAVIVLASGFAFGTAFLIFGFALSVVVSYINDRKTILFALISNVIFIACVLIQKYIVLAQPFDGWTSDTSKILFILFGVSFFLALVVSVPTALIRKEIREN